MKKTLPILMLIPWLAGCAHNEPSVPGGAYGRGYTAGRSDGIKTIYKNLMDQQRGTPADTGASLYEVTIPEHWENGVLVKPTKRVIRIAE